MDASARPSAPAEPVAVHPRPVALGLKLALAASLAATLALGAARPLPTALLLLQGFCTALGGLSLLLALLQREALRPRLWSHWHEAASLGVAGALGHLALLLLR
jgi:hypothetical protein